MAATSPRRLVNPMLGIYFGIFASLVTGMAIVLLILEQLGVSDGIVRYAMLLVPLTLYIAIGLAARSQDPADYFAAGRRVPAGYTGLVMAGSAIGGTGLVAGTGLFFINGFDAWCIPIGIWSGFVVMALLVAPYIRKFGTYTIPSYLGRRLDNRMVRVTAATLMLAPMLLVVVAELKTGAYAASWLTGLSQPLALQLLVLALVPALILGGMRSLTWTNAAQAIVLILALVLPVAIVAGFETNLPLPQLSHGPVLRAIGRREAAQAVAMPFAGMLTLDFAGTELRALAHRIAHPYATVGPAAFVLMIVTMICGVASAPWLLPRVTATPGVYDTRKSAAWAIVFCGLVLLTSASVAVFLRDIVMDQLVNRNAENVPDWFRFLVGHGDAAFDTGVSQLAVSNISFKRDAVLFTLPIAGQFSAVVLYMALAGAVAAALLGASSAIVASANVIAEDGVGGLVWEPAAGIRIFVARAALVAVALLSGWIAMLIPADPLDLLLWGFSLTAATAFPVMVLSVLWRRFNAFGAMLAMIAGFVTTLLAILAGEAAWLGVPGTLSAALGMPAAFLAAAIASRISPAPDKNVLTLLRDMRLPGGETIHDREIRIQRMKQQRGP